MEEREGEGSRDVKEESDDFWSWFGVFTHAVASLDHIYQVFIYKIEDYFSF